VRTGFIWLKIGTSGGICEHGNEHSDSIIYKEYPDQASDYYLLKKDSVPLGYLKVYN
jgi:hypothetical protein